MNALRLTFVVFLLLAESGCASNVPSARAQIRLGKEAVSPRVTQRTLRGWRQEVWPRWETVEVMQAEVERRGERLLGAAFVRGGMHPYWIVAFIDSGERVLVVETDLFWGSVRSKRAAWIAQGEYQSVVDSAREGLRCAEGDGAELEDSWNAVFIQGDDEQTVCAVDVFEDWGSFGERVLG